MSSTTGIGHPRRGGISSTSVSGIPSSSMRTRRRFTSVSMRAPAQAGEAPISAASCSHVSNGCLSWVTPPSPRWRESFLSDRDVRGEEPVRRTRLHHPRRAGDLGSRRIRTVRNTSGFPTTPVSHREGLRARASSPTRGCPDAKLHNAEGVTE